MINYRPINQYPKQESFQVCMDGPKRAINWFVNCSDNLIFMVRLFLTGCKHSHHGLTRNLILLGVSSLLYLPNFRAHLSFSVPNFRSISWSFLILIVFPFVSFFFGVWCNYDLILSSFNWFFFFSVSFLSLPSSQFIIHWPFLPILWNPSDTFESHYLYMDRKIGQQTIWSD